MKESSKRAAARLGGVNAQWAGGAGIVAASPRAVDPKSIE